MVTSVIYLDNAINSIKLSQYRIELINKLGSPNLTASNSILKLFAPYFDDDTMKQLETLLGRLSDSAINFIEFALNSKELSYDELAYIKNLILRILDDESLTEKVIMIAEHFNEDTGNNFAIALKIAKLVNLADPLPMGNIEIPSLPTGDELIILATGRELDMDFKRATIVLSSEHLGTELYELLKKISNSQPIFDKYQRLTKKLPPGYHRDFITMLHDMPLYELFNMIRFLDKLNGTYLRDTISLIHDESISLKRDYTRVMIMLNNRGLLKLHLNVAKRVPNLRAYLDVMLRLNKTSATQLIDILSIYNSRELNKMLIALNKTRNISTVVDELSRVSKIHLKQLVTIINEKDSQFISYGERIALGLRKRLPKQSVTNAIQNGIELGVRVGEYDKIKASMYALLHEREHRQERILEQSKIGGYSGHSINTMTEIYGDLDKHRTNTFADVLSGNLGLKFQLGRSNTRHITDETAKFRINQYTSDNVEQQRKLQERVDFFKRATIIVPHIK